MDDIQRQRNPDLLEAVKLAISGDVKSAFERLSQIQTEPCLLYTSPSPRDS